MGKIGRWCVICGEGESGRLDAGEEKRYVEVQSERESVADWTLQARE